MASSSSVARDAFFAQAVAQGFDPRGFRIGGEKLQKKKRPRVSNLKKLIRADRSDEAQEAREKCREWFSVWEKRGGTRSRGDVGTVKMGKGEVEIDEKLAAPSQETGRSTSVQLRPKTASVAENFEILTGHALFEVKSGVDHAPSVGNAVPLPSASSSSSSSSNARVELIIQAKPKRRFEPVQTLCDFKMSEEAWTERLRQTAREILAATGTASTKPDCVPGQDELPPDHSTGDATHQNPARPPAEDGAGQTAGAATTTTQQQSLHWLPPPEVLVPQDPATTNWRTFFQVLLSGSGPRNDREPADHESRRTREGQQNGDPSSIFANNAQHTSSSTARRTVRHYVHSLLSKDFDEKIKALLLNLNSYQERARERDLALRRNKAGALAGDGAAAGAAAPGAKAKRLVLGLREIERGLKREKLLGLIVAPDLDKSATGLDATIESLMEKCLEKQIPLLFALSRREMGYVLKRLKGGAGTGGPVVQGVSAVGLLSVEGQNREWKAIVKQAEELKTQWVQEQMMQGLS